MGRVSWWVYGVASRNHKYSLILEALVGSVLPPPREIFSQPFFSLITSEFCALVAQGYRWEIMSLAQILIELDQKPTHRRGISSSSRASSAAYAIAAWTSASLRGGYPEMISSAVKPAAKLSKITDTMIRVPLMQGLPWQILGSEEMRSSGFAYFFFSCLSPLLPI